MHDLPAITPLGGTEARIDVHDGVTIREIADIALASLSFRRGREQEARRRAEAFLGAALPGPNGHLAGDPFSATWMGPDQWFVSAALPAHELLADALKQAVGDSASVTEQSDGWCGFALEGPRVPRLLEKLTAVDMAQAEAGRSARLRLEHLSCLVICLENYPEKSGTFVILGPRSSAGSLHHVLRATAGV